MNRRDVIRTGAAAAAALSFPGFASAQQTDLDPVWREIERSHDQNLERLQAWIRLPAIAAENRGMHESCEQTMGMLREAGFQNVTKVTGKGQPAIFATLDAGAPSSVGVYWMYDVKQADPAEWSSPPWEAQLVEKPGLGKVVMGRGAVNQKGPQSSFLAAVRAIQAAGRKLPVNIVLVAEGEEEIGSPNFPEIVQRPEVQSALRRCKGIFMPSATQGPDGSVVMTFGAKGVIEVELVSDGERSGFGPARDVHSSNKARIESPAWRLVHALATLTTKNGDQPAIEGFAARARPLSAAEKEMIETAARRLKEDVAKQQLGVKRWIDNASWQRALEMLMGDPTVNIEGLVGGYTGPGGKTILPHRAIAKLDLRLVPDMTADGALAALKSHLASHGYSDIEVTMTGGYNPTSTSPDAPLVRAQQAAYRRFGVDPVLLPRNAGSWPGYVFTDPPLSLAAGHFGLGHGAGAHAPDEFYLIDSARPEVMGLDGAIRSFAAYLYELAAVV